MIQPGTHLGPYQIGSQLGAGGMGEVYRATDTRLDRTVAIKVLPELLASDPSRRERFEREARAVSSLNHPHICTLHDVGEQEGTHFLVMELVEGETLESRLEKGRLPLDQALEYAIQIADALDKAHRQGVVHRDLKPANIMITKSGVKLLDFGLAKLKGDASPTSGLSQAPTRKNLTAEGTILGTLQYMAPEQLDGQEADARTDIFAFGAVVYEMVTGTRAFEGASQASLIAAIIERELKPMRTLQAVTPPALDRVVGKCLAKEADRRWHSAGDLCDELRWIRDSRSEASLEEAVSSRLPVPLWRRQVSVLWPVGLAVVFIGVMGWRDFGGPPALSPGEVTRVVMTLPADHQLNRGFWGAPVALSPDGRWLAYVVESDPSAPELYLRAMDEVEPRLVGSGQAPFFSPNSQTLAFAVGNEIRRTPVTGGPTLTVCECVSNPRGLSWGPDDTIVFSPSPLGGIWQVSAEGGTATQLTTLDTDSGENSHQWPELLPGGSALLFSASAEGDWPSGRIFVQERGTGDRRVLVENATYARYSQTGHLVYFRQGALMARPFDLGLLDFTGAERPIVQGVSQNFGTGEPRAAFSNSGTLVYLQAEFGNSLDATSLTWIDRNESLERVDAESGAYLWPTLSRDSERMALRVHEPRSNVWVYEFANGAMNPLTAGQNAADFPIWSPDGERIAFSSSLDGPWNLYLRAADFSGGEVRLTTAPRSQIVSSWSPDGRWLAYNEIDPTSSEDADIWVLPIEDAGEPIAVHESDSFDGGAVFSPNGDRIAFTSNQSGDYEIYVKPFPGPGIAQMVSGGNGGQQPVWSADGQRIYYLDNDQRVLRAVTLTTGPTLNPGRPEAVLEFDRFAGIAPPLRPNFDVSPDGQRFLFVRLDDQPAEPTPLVVVLNWHQELLERAPAD